MVVNETELAAELAAIVRQMPDMQRTPGLTRWEDRFPYESSTLADWIERHPDPNMRVDAADNAHSRFHNLAAWRDLDVACPWAHAGHCISHYFERKKAGDPHLGANEVEVITAHRRSRTGQP